MGFGEKCLRSFSTIRGSRGIREDFFCVDRAYVSMGFVAERVSFRSDGAALGDGTSFVPLR